MSLKEKLAAKRAQKEQKEAEKQLNIVGKTAEGTANLIAAEHNPIDLDKIISAANQFAEGQKNEEFMKRLLNDPIQRVRYELVKDHMSGEWLTEMNKLASVIPTLKRKNLQVLSWMDWKIFADEAGLDEKGLDGSLRVIAIFSHELKKQNQKRLKLKN